MRGRGWIVFFFFVEADQASKMVTLLCVCGRGMLLGVKAGQGAGEGNAT